MNNGIMPQAFDAWTIAKAFMADRWLRSMVMPNFTPVDWWECDVMEITAAAYWIEYEIKISRGDFFADAKKFQQNWNRETQTYCVETKHGLLAAKSEKGPSRFCFIVPKDMVGTHEIPAFAGLIYADRRERYIHFETVIKAPLLHRVKLDENHKHRRGIWRSCYSRFHSSISSMPQREPEGIQ